MTATLLVLSGLAGVFVAPSPAGAADVTVTVHDTYFEPATVYARPRQKIVFVLADPNDIHHTVTIEPADCGGRPASLCEQRFDNGNDRSRAVEFYFSDYAEYGFFDRYAREAGREMTGRFIISAADPTVPPSSSSTSSSTTSTTAAPTATSSTTTTTAPTPVRPFLVPDPAPTTTTTAAAVNLPAAPSAPAPANKDGKAKEKDKGKVKAASTQTPTTVGPNPADAMPPDSVFDPAALTPGPTLLPDTPADSGDEAAIDASSAANFLDGQSSEDDTGKLLLMALASLALLLAVGGTWAFFTRSSRYDPA